MNYGVWFKYSLWTFFESVLKQIELEMKHVCRCLHPYWMNQLQIANSPKSVEFYGHTVMLIHFQCSDSLGPTVGPWGDSMGPR